MPSGCIASGPDPAPGCVMGLKYSTLLLSEKNGRLVTVEQRAQRGGDGQQESGLEEVISTVPNMRCLPV